MSTFESRKLYRADIILRVEYETTNRKPFTEGIAFSKNLSCVGICVVMSDELSNKCTLDLAIHLPNKKKAIFARGEVLWQAECPSYPQGKRKYYTTGIQFSNMSTSDAIKESDFIKGVLIQKSEKENKLIIKKLEKLHNTKK